MRNVDILEEKALAHEELGEEEAAQEAIEQADEIRAAEEEEITEEF